jgi:hypothetical protein
MQPSNVDTSNNASIPKLRIARPTNQMQELVRFYRDGLGLEELGGFEDHGGFDGVMLGHRNAPYHPAGTNGSLWQKAEPWERRHPAGISGSYRRKRSSHRNR